MGDQELKKKFYGHMIQFLAKEIAHYKQCSEDDVCESLEVAKQCLENAFGLENAEEQPEQFDLMKVYDVGLNVLSGKPCPKAYPEASPEDKEKAEKLKTQGNLCMQENMFAEAVDCYSKALDLVRNNAVFYCNRAAAYSRLNDNEKAIKDCEVAIEIDPNYSKAYARMGLAFSAAGNHSRAVSSYKRALELDPANASYKSSLSSAEAQVAAPPAAGGLPPGLAGMFGGGGAAPGGMDLSALLNNPNMMSMASQMLSNPQMQSMISNMMSGMSNQSQDGAAAADPNISNMMSGMNAQNNANSTTPTGGAENMDDFLRVGQQFAQQMRDANPTLVENLRQQFQSNNPNTPNPNPEQEGGNPPPGTS